MSGLEVIAIDGPAGSGKTTIARALADRLELAYLDTGAMYRAVAFAALRAGTDLGDEVAVARTARDMGLDRESTRLNSSHREISYSGVCLEKKKLMN